MRIEIASENSLIVYLSDIATPQVSAQVQQLSELVRSHCGNILIDLVPSYASLLVIFDDTQCQHFSVQSTLVNLIAMLREPATSVLQNLKPASQAKTIELPAYYSKESGPDLELMARNCNLSIDQIIEIHQSMEYQVYAIGFAPGFAYLGEVDPRIAAPRHATPRSKVAKGAIAIADRQTAVYPSESPGGWNLIGLCPVDMFNAKQNPTMPVAVGDKVKFKAIAKHEFITLGGQL